MGRIFFADAAAFNANGIKALSASALRRSFIKSNLVCSNGPKSLLKHPPDCPILCNFSFGYFYISWGFICKSFTKFQNLESFLELQSRFDKIFKVTSVLFFVLYFNLLSCELANFTFEVLYWVILH